MKKIIPTDFQQLWRVTCASIFGEGINRASTLRIFDEDIFLSCQSKQSPIAELDLPQKYVKCLTC